MKVCSVDGCNNKHFSRSMCKKHYERFRKYGDVHFIKVRASVYEGCSVEGCCKPNFSRGMCRNHYAQDWYKRKAIKKYKAMV